jgi:sugar-specific transcriptional regulator TrmB
MHVEKSVQNKLVSYFKQLGLEHEQSLIYLFLLQSGPQTVLAISRGLKTGRTKLYPLLESLGDKQLITIHERHYGTSYEAQPPEVLEFLVSERERSASALRTTLPSAVHALQAIQQTSPSSSRIVEYKGVDGLKQMNWNLTKSEGEYRVFELAGLDKHLGNHFAEKMRARDRDKGVKSYDLTNNPNRHHEPGIETKNNLARYIDPKVFNIQFESFIYNNCVALLNYERDDIFGVEIYNPKLAAQQKQIFDLLWSQAKVL